MNEKLLTEIIDAFIKLYVLNDKTIEFPKEQSFDDDINIVVDTTKDDLYDVALSFIPKNEDFQSIIYLKLLLFRISRSYGLFIVYENSTRNLKYNTYLDKYKRLGMYINPSAINKLAGLKVAYASERNNIVAVDVVNALKNELSRYKLNILMSVDGNSAVLIGNGLDVALGLKTSYSSFYLSEYFRALVDAKNWLAIYVEAQKIRNNENWSDLEYMIYEFAQFYMSVKNVKSMHEYINQHCSKEAVEAFKLIERDYNKIACILNDEFRTIIEVYNDKNVKNLRIYYEDLKQNISKYLKKYNDYVEFEKDNNVIPLLKLIEKWIMTSHNKYDSVVFNYTDTFSSILQSLQQKHIMNRYKEPIYVHGKFDEDDNIVLGIDDSMVVDENLEFLKKVNDIEACSRRGYKPKIQNAVRYILYGISFGKTDDWYLSQVFNPDNTRKIFEIYCYGEVEIARIQGRIKELVGEEKYDDFMNTNKVLFIDDKFDSESASQDILINRRKNAYMNSLVIG